MRSAQLTQPNNTNTWPIGIRLFNRPDYAERLLHSLREQTLAIDAQSLYFIIDGFTGSRDALRGRTDFTSQVAKLAAASFPGAHIERCATNIGIAQTAFQLQQQVFQKEGAQWAIFLEEDIVLDARYLEALHHMINLAQDVPEIVKISANQVNLNYLKRPPKPERRNFYLGQGTQAFAERRDFFNARKHLTEIYLGVIAGRQYSDRDESEVFATMAENGVFTNMGNNDVVHDRITMALKGIHVVSAQKLLTDIGVAGETSYAYPEIALPDSNTSDVLATTKDDFLHALPELRAEAQEFEHLFFKTFWGGYMASKSGSLALKVLRRKILGFFKPRAK